MTEFVSMHCILFLLRASPKARGEPVQPGFIPSGRNIVARFLSRFKKRPIELLEQDQKTIADNGSTIKGQKGTRYNNCQLKPKSGTRQGQATSIQAGARQ
ncbi:hypothetical protein NA56DRAFT_705264 [Hyaloscypha hepaticicola]|uniref:Secreted protein n=1 Tax=Hyaloscypha hepaticicola TaxID=2082293 RepID=A0A2J6Q165_9HELO|nr:hypothetical protein NA56DRAFT_705264 [Hyaloscypha hepaticicola]